MATSNVRHLTTQLQSEERMKETLKSAGRPVYIASMEFDASPLCIQSETIWGEVKESNGNRNIPYFPELR